MITRPLIYPLSKHMEKATCPYMAIISFSSLCFNVDAFGSLKEHVAHIRFLPAYQGLMCSVGVAVYCFKPIA